MGGGGAQNQQNAITQQGLQQSAEQFQASQADKARMNALEAPAIANYQSLISGDPAVATAAAQPIISNVTSGYNAAKESIFNTVAPGAGRDYALAQLPVQANAAISSGITSQTLAAYDKLANLGAGLGSFSLQELGAGSNLLGQASNSNQSVMSAQEQSKASTMGFLGQIVGGVAGNSGLFKSDRRLKQNIVSAPDMLDRLRRVRLVEFDYIDGGTDQLGVIAQELMPIFPDAVSTGADGYLQVDYARLYTASLKALQELATIVDEQKEKISYLMNYAVQ